MEAALELTGTPGPEGSVRVGGERPTVGGGYELSFRLAEGEEHHKRYWLRIVPAAKPDEEIFVVAPSIELHEERPLHFKMRSSFSEALEPGIHSLQFVADGDVLAASEFKV